MGLVSFSSWLRLMDVSEFIKPSFQKKDNEISLNFPTYEGESNINRNLFIHIQYLWNNIKNLLLISRNSLFHVLYIFPSNMGACDFLARRNSEANSWSNCAQSCQHIIRCRIVPLQVFLSRKHIEANHKVTNLVILPPRSIQKALSVLQLVAFDFSQQ